MDFNDYEQKAAATALYVGKGGISGTSYCTLGLTGEAGEVANKVKKILRGDKGLEESKQGIVEELGDVLWYISELAGNLGVSLADVAARNIEKLLDRRGRGVVRGSGDSR